MLAVATFSSVRSANRSARVAELSLLTGLRPVLVRSREDDPDMHVRFADDHNLVVSGDGVQWSTPTATSYLALSLRNGGSGLAVLHRRRAESLGRERVQDRPNPAEFRRQQLDVYILAGDSGYWQGAIRDRDDPLHDGIRAGLSSASHVAVDLMYGDHEAASGRSRGSPSVRTPRPARCARSCFAAGTSTATILADLQRGLRSDG